jgi:hypothetical protein
MSGAKSQDFVYIGASLGATIGPHEGAVLVYTYPALDYVGEWIANSTSSGNGGVFGLCSDTSGSVYALYYVSSTYGIAEFSHGATTPTRTLQDPSGYPWACSVDPASGDLAVVNLPQSQSSPGALLIYHGSSGTPATFNDSDLSFAGVGYDDEGNIVVDGRSPVSRKPGLAILARGSKKFSNIKLDKSMQLQDPGLVQWDGKYMTVSGSDVIYELSIKKGRSTVAGTTTLLGVRNPCGKYNCSYGFVPSWISGKVVLGAESWCLNGVPCSGGLAYWHYPKGGRPFDNHWLEYALGGVTLSAVTK